MPNYKKPELLMPAGSPDKLRYAVAYGADAVYLGLPVASLRTPSRGAQFTPKNLAEHIHWTQQQGVKAYVTANIFANNRDLPRLAAHFEQLQAIKPDALIISDPGIFRLARKHAPSIPVHLSTQANTLNKEACAFWQDNGVSRVILAREVPVHEMADIHEYLPDLELECFIHGSICVAYSGRCVISDYLTDNTKNSNKGMCGNSCRWEFKPVEDDALNQLTMTEATRPDTPYTFEEDDRGTYMLNSKDMCLVGALDKLVQAGIVSLKVEGRTKSLYYAAAVTHVYRQAIDWWHNQQWQGELPVAQKARWVQELAMAGNRGFTEGFLHGRPDDSAYNYLNSQSHQTAQFLGTTQWDAERQQLCLTARNPINAKAPMLQWLTPTGVATADLMALTDAHGLPVHTLQTNQQGWLPLAAVPALTQTTADMGLLRGMLTPLPQATPIALSQVN
jgi:U32 family peptidase